MKQVDRMRSLSSYLPDGDVSLANEFINSRDFESLRDLVESAIIKVKRYRSKVALENIPIRKEYLNVDLVELNNLKAEIDVYLAQLDIVNINNDIEEDYDNEEY